MINIIDSIKKEKDRDDGFQECLDHSQFVVHGSWVGVCLISMIQVSDGWDDIIQWGQVLDPRFQGANIKVSCSDSGKFAI